MARPFKQGLQYFPLDVNLFEDDKIQLVSNLYGFAGELLYIKLLTMIYANGYYLERTIPTLARSIYKSYPGSSPTQEEIEAMIRYFGEVRLLDQRLLMSGVLTSVAIQKQFLLSTRRRRKIEIEQYWLLSTETTETLKNMQNVNADNNRDNADNNPPFLAQNGVNVYSNRVIDDTSTQSKGKERINDKYVDKRAPCAPSLHYLTNCLIEAKYESAFSVNLPLYEGLFPELIESYGFEQIWTVTRYIIKAAKNSGTLVDNRYEYFKVAAQNNLEAYQKRKERSNESFEEWAKRTLLSVAG